MIKVDPADLVKGENILLEIRLLDILQVIAPEAGMLMIQHFFFLVPLGHFSAPFLNMHKQKRALQPSRALLHDECPVVFNPWEARPVPEGCKACAPRPISWHSGYRPACIPRTASVVLFRASRLFSLREPPALQMLKYPTAKGFFINIAITTPCQ
jgi:hypothetical protein